ncbi:hypothetical protein GQR58_008721 [Nymphon striatum]|nr:hypothetical protein GQR58_008721 [Nymphon striatum]
MECYQSGSITLSQYFSNIASRYRWHLRILASPLHACKSENSFCRISHTNVLYEEIELTESFYTLRWAGYQSAARLLLSTCKLVPIYTPGSPVLSIGSSFNPISVKLSYFIHPPSPRFTPFPSSPICYPHCGFSGPPIVCSTGQVSSPVPLATLHCLGQIFTPCVCPHPTISLSIPPAHT